MTIQNYTNYKIGLYLCCDQFSNDSLESYSAKFFRLLLEVQKFFEHLEIPLRLLFIMPAS